jgi:hypothetical protein
MSHGLTTAGIGGALVGKFRSAAEAEATVQQPRNNAPEHRLPLIFTALPGSPALSVEARAREPLAGNKTAQRRRSALRLASRREGKLKRYYLDFIFKFFHIL